MEAPFQIVGCLLSSKPAEQLVDGFVAQVRRERAVVTDKTARGATFVRFNAPDAKLVTMACEALVSFAGSALRFGFASGVRERGLTRQDALSISHRSMAQARDLAGAARRGEVLVSPQTEVRHLFREYLPYDLDWSCLVHNKLRLAYLHFNEDRCERVVDALQREERFAAGMKLLDQSDVAGRRLEFDARRVHDDDWFFNKFGPTW